MINDENISDYKNIIDNSINLPISLSKYCFKEINSRTNNGFSKFINNEYQIKIEEETSKSFYNLQEKYKQHQQNALINKKILEVNSELIKNIVQVASVPISYTGIGSVVAAGINIFMDNLLDYALDSFDESIQLSSSKIIGYHLKKVRENTGKSLEEISGMKKEEAHNLLFNSNIGIMDNSIDFLNPDDKINIIHQMSKVLEDKLVHASALNKLVNDSQDLDLEYIKSEIIHISKVQKNYQKSIKEINGDIINLQKNFKNLNDSVEILHSEVNINSENIDILKNHIFSNANVDDKIKLLRSGLLDKQLSSERKSKLEKHLKAVQAKQDIQKNIYKYLNKTRHITTILSNVGFDSKTLQTANKLINIGNTAMNAFVAYKSGHVLESISIASSLFGKSKSDPAIQRHKQIMNKLGVLDGKLDRIIETHITIMKNQHFIIDTLGKISNKIDRYHSQEMELLSDINDNILYNRLSNIQLAAIDLNVLVGFSKPFKKLMASENNSYNDIVDFYRVYGDRFEKHNLIFNKVLTAHYSGSIHPVFRLKEYEIKGINPIKNNINPISDILKGFNLLVAYIDNYTNLNKKIDLYSNTLINNVYALDKKFKAVSEIKKIKKSYLSWELVKSNLIFVRQLKSVFEILEQVHIFYLLQKDENSESQLKTIKNLFSTNLHNTKGNVYFKELLTLINLSIIQQNLMCGDILLENFYNRLFIDKIKQKTPEHALIISVLNNNRLLKLNFTKYFIKKQLEKPRKIFLKNKELDYTFDFFEYNLYLANTSNYAKNPKRSTNLRRCFDDNLKSEIIFHKNKWKLCLQKGIQEAYLELPNTNEFRKGEIEYTNEIYTLLNLKNKVIDKISEYELQDFIAPKKNLYKHLKFN